MTIDDDWDVRQEAKMNKKSILCKLNVNDLDEHLRTPKYFLIISHYFISYK